MADSIVAANDLRPAYYDDFHCLASDCHLSCCMGWHISFDKKDYLSIKHQRGTSDLNRRIEHGLCRIRRGPLAEMHYGEFKMENGTCPLLRADGLCILQLEKGHDALPFVCRIFPRVEVFQPSGYLERSLSPACEAVLGLLWELPEGVGFLSDPLPKERWQRLTFRNPDGLGKHFQEIRSQCIDMLQDRRFPMSQRILMMGIALKALVDGERDIARWIENAQKIPNQFDLEQLFDVDHDGNTLKMFLSNNIRLLLATNRGNPFSKIATELEGGLGITINPGTRSATISTEQWLAAKEKFGNTFENHTYFIENLMVSLFFHLHFPDMNSIEKLWKSYVSFCNLYSFYWFMAVLSCRENVIDPKAELFRLITMASRELIHNQSRQAELRDEFFQNDSATLAHMAVLLSN